MMAQNNKEQEHLDKIAPISLEYFRANQSSNKRQELNGQLEVHNTRKLRASGGPQSSTDHQISMKADKLQAEETYEKGSFADEKLPSQSRFGNRQSNRNGTKGNGQQLPSPTSLGSASSGSLSAPTSHMPLSPGLAPAMSNDLSNPNSSQAPAADKSPFFFREDYAGLIVKGNFMTLAAKPIHVELGEWLAHQGGEFSYVLFREMTDPP